MNDVYLIGTACTPFGKFADKSFKDLTREAYSQVLADAGLDDGGAIEQGWFGNCGMGSFGQACIRGQVCFTPLVREGLFPERVPKRTKFVELQEGKNALRSPCLLQSRSKSNHHGF